ncbi:unnamed protein product, partial [Rotaria magnacalcarata]
MIISTAIIPAATNIPHITNPQSGHQAPRRERWLGSIVAHKHMK